MTPQIIGTKKDAGTRSAIRFFKERTLEFQFIDIHERTLSKGEWESLFHYITPEELISKNSQYYKKKGYEYLEFDPVEELMEHIELLVIPVIRCSSGVVAGFDSKRITDLLR